MPATRGDQNTPGANGAVPTALLTVIVFAGVVLDVQFAVVAVDTVMVPAPDGTVAVTVARWVSVTFGPAVARHPVNVVGVRPVQFTVLVVAARGDRESSAA